MLHPCAQKIIKSHILNYYKFPYIISYKPSTDHFKSCDKRSSHWTGTYLCINVATYAVNIIHELSHWLLSTPKQRCDPLFMLTNDSLSAEVLARVYDSIIAESLGFKKSFIQKTISDLKMSFGNRWEDFHSTFIQSFTCPLPEDKFLNTRSLNKVKYYFCQQPPPEDHQEKGRIVV